jgi:hypothetical protein
VDAVSARPPVDVRIATQPRHVDRVVALSHGRVARRGEAAIDGDLVAQGEVPLP